MASAASNVCCHVGPLSSSARTVTRVFTTSGEPSMPVLNINCKLKHFKALLHVIVKDNIKM